jgi:ABC-2 type transport system ATP-binding protein
MINVIQVNKLVKKYGKLTAVNGISFEVQKGEIFGLLGENGAGKTTTLEIIEGLRSATSGNIKVLGYDTKKEIREIKKRIGVQLQSSAYYNFLRLDEILKLFGHFYNKEVDTAKLFDMVGLRSKSHQYVNSLSGGQKQRFSIVASLINDPEIVFLDEPTTGLDPVGRRNTWDIIAKIKEQGKTIVLTTHYMEEAEILCDRIAIMEKGNIVAMDKTIKLLENAKNPYKLNFVLKTPDEKFVQSLADVCAKESCSINKLPGKTLHYEVHLQSKETLNKAILLLQKKNPDSFTIGRATLEDLFIELTGKTIKQVEEEENGNV